MGILSAILWVYTDIFLKTFLPQSQKAKAIFATFINTIAIESIQFLSKIT